MILLVDDDPETAQALTTVLESNGYRVTIAQTGSAARSIIEHMRPDLIMLDLMLPDTDGLVLTAAFKTLTNAPIIICSARQGQVDRVLGLKLGADDFIAKPFELEELEARVEAVLRRASRVSEVPAVPPNQIRVDDLVISQSRGTVLLAGHPVRLTPTEYRLLVALASRPDEVLSREALGQLVWGYDDIGTGHLIDVHIGRLRLKLRRPSSSDPVIVTVRGKGYTIGTVSSNPADEGESTTMPVAVASYPVSPPRLRQRLGEPLRVADGILHATDASGRTVCTPPPPAQTAVPHASYEYALVVPTAAGATGRRGTPSPTPSS